MGQALFRKLAGTYPANDVLDELNPEEPKLARLHREYEQAKAEYQRAKAESELFDRWAEAERAKGRPEAELIWGNCVAETGARRPAVRH